MDEARQSAVRRASVRAVRWRPAMLLLGGLAAALAETKLQEGFLLPALIALAVVPTGVVALIGFSSRLETFARLASPSFGLLGWGGYAIFTGGLESPFVAAFILEIVVAGLSLGPRGVGWVTANALAVMTLVERIFYDWSTLGLLAVEAVFVVAIGVMGAVMARRRLAGEVALRTQGEELGARLDALQRELEDERVISRVGESVARLAHGLKNAVHSLRGFVALLEPELGTGPGARAALRGLHAAIDDLEKLARMTLAEREGGATTARAAAPPATGHDAGAGDSAPTEDEGASIGVTYAGEGAVVADVVEAAHAELVAASPEVRWRVVEAAGAKGLTVAIEAAPLTELLVILMRNAVEAMEGAGEATLEFGANGGLGLLVVSDAGPGFDPEDLANIFQPGYTTKPKGSGFGLFLARRIVEDHGGALALEEADGGGARVRVELPRLGGA